jgi:hypothetical protein
MFPYSLDSLLSPQERNYCNKFLVYFRYVKCAINMIYVVTYKYIVSQPVLCVYKAIIFILPQDKMINCLLIKNTLQW